MSLTLKGESDGKMAESSLSLKSYFFFVKIQELLGIAIPETTKSHKMQLTKIPKTWSKRAFLERKSD